MAPSRLTRLPHQGRHRLTFRDLLNKQHGGIRGPRLIDFIEKKRKRQEQEQAKKKRRELLRDRVAHGNPVTVTTAASGDLSAVLTRRGWHGAKNKGVSTVNHTGLVPLRSPVK
jgi:predicted ThiF/HesA family dinucleotide-utilizing enzyme